MKAKNIIIISICVLLLTGCNTKIEYSGETEDILSEYMAGMLLYNSSGFSITTLENSELKNDINNVDDKGGNANTDKKDDEVVDKGKENSYTTLDLDDFNIDKKLVLEYKGSDPYDYYPRDLASYFTLKPRQGYELLVVRFGLKNNSKNTVKLNLTKEKFKYKLVANKNTKLKPLLTLLENDLQYLDTSVDSKETKEVVLIFEIEKGVKFNNLDLEIEDDGLEKTYKLY